MVLAEMRPVGDFAWHLGLIIRICGSLIVQSAFSVVRDPLRAQAAFVARIEPPTT